MDEPLAWESTTPCYIRFITDSRYRKLRLAYQRWYRPICPVCGPRLIEKVRKDDGRDPHCAAPGVRREEN